MGADMCIMSICSKPNIDLNKAQEQMVARLKERGGLTAEEESQVEDEYGYSDFDTAGAEETIKEFCSCIGDRDTAELNFPERTIYLTGGMSWGDDPTDSYDKFMRFSYLPADILEAGGFINEYVHPVDTFLELYGSKLPEDTVKQIKSLKLSEEL